jgi:predicted GTPase
MHLASRALAAGAGFRLLAPRRTMLRAAHPVVAVTAVRTGCGKSAVSRRVAAHLRERGRRVGVIRHPMPYGDLLAQRVQRLATLEDLDRADATIEEREEYEPHIEAGHVVWAGVDYQAILARAEAEADVLVWDGGNNDLPFIAPSLHLCLVDPLRAGHESRYHPGEANLRRADVAVIVKADSVSPETLMASKHAVRALNPTARVMDTRFTVQLDDPERIRGRRVLAVDDGPTLTHGEMPDGVAAQAARRLGAVLVDPRPYAQGALRDVYRDHPHLGPVLPTLGYGPTQLTDLRATIDAVPCDLVLVGTPIDLGRRLGLRAPTTRVRYEVEAIGHPGFDELLSHL